MTGLYYWSVVVFVFLAVIGCVSYWNVSFCTFYCISNYRLRLRLEKGDYVTFPTASSLCVSGLLILDWNDLFAPRVGFEFLPLTVASLIAVVFGFSAISGSVVANHVIVWLSSVTL